MNISQDGVLDTVGLLALWDEADQWHPLAKASFTQLTTSRANFVTSSLILIECGNAAARRPYRLAVVRLRNQMERTERLIEPTPGEIRDAWATYAAGAIHSAGIVDHVSFSVMRRLNISKAFTNDQHFRSAGFETLF